MTAFLKPYTCLVCGGKERLSMWDLERKTKPRCPHCGSLSLVRDNNLVPKPKKNPNQKPKRAPRSPEQAAKAKLTWIKRHHADFQARRKYGWKPKETASGPQKLSDKACRETTSCGDASSDARTT